METTWYPEEVTQLELIPGKENLIAYPVEIVLGRAPMRKCKLLLTLDTTIYPDAIFSSGDMIGAVRFLYANPVLLANLGSGKQVFPGVTIQLMKE